MGNRIGGLKGVANRKGIPFSAYQSKISSGLKWCTGCKDWHPVANFPRDRSRGDGLNTKCLKSNRGKPRRPRNKQHEIARHKIAYAVQRGDLLSANKLQCKDCGHFGRDRRHEYDHYRGYDFQHWFDVEPVCTICHAEREVQRRNQKIGRLSK